MVEGEGDAVGYLNPLLAMAAVINVSLPGQQPELRSATEDMRLFDSALADKSGRSACCCHSDFVSDCVQPVTCHYVHRMYVIMCAWAGAAVHWDCCACVAVFTLPTAAYHPPLRLDAHGMLG
jgi:hypothetical protein